MTSRLVMSIQDILRRILLFPAAFPLPAAPPFRRPSAPLSSARRAPWRPGTRRLPRPHPPLFSGIVRRSPGPPFPDTQSPGPHFSGRSDFPRSRISSPYRPRILSRVPAPQSPLRVPLPLSSPSCPGPRRGKTRRNTSIQDMSGRLFTAKEPRSGPSAAKKIDVFRLLQTCCVDTKNLRCKRFSPQTAKTFRHVASIQDAS